MSDWDTHQSLMTIMEWGFELSNSKTSSALQCFTLGYIDFRFICFDKISHNVSLLGLWRLLKVSDWDLAFWSRFENGIQSLMNPCSNFCMLTLILRVQRTLMSFNPDWGFEGLWSLLTMTSVWYFDLYMDIVTSL